MFAKTPQNNSVKVLFKGYSCCTFFCHDYVIAADGSSSSLRQIHTSSSTPPFSFSSFSSHKHNMGNPTLRHLTDVHFRITPSLSPIVPCHVGGDGITTTTTEGGVVATTGTKVGRLGKNCFHLNKNRVFNRRQTTLSSNECRFCTYIVVILIL